MYCIYDVSVVSQYTLYLNKILFTLNSEDPDQLASEKPADQYPHCFRLEL